MEFGKTARNPQLDHISSHNLLTIIAATQILFTNLSEELNKEKSLLSFKLVFLGLFNGFSFSFLEMKVTLCFLFFILIYLFSSITLIKHLKVVF